MNNVLRTPQLRKLVLWGLALIGGILVLTSIALLVVNRVVLPRLLTRTENRLVDLGINQLTMESARYSLLRGVTLRGVVLELDVGTDSTGAGFPVRMEMTRVRARVPLDGTPRRVIMLDTRILVPGAVSALVSVAIDDLEIVHDDHHSTVSIRATGPSDDALTATIEVDYEDRVGAGEMAVRAVPVAVGPVSIVEAGGRLSFRVTDRFQIALDGEVELRTVTLELPSIADEPISDLDVRYQFAATFNPHESLAPQYWGNPVFPPPEFPKGELVFTAGDLQVNQIKLSLIPIFRGIAAGPRPETGLLRGRPGFFQARISLPETPVQQILDTVPAAISGLLAQTSVTGTLAWNLDLRVPLDAIAEMEWTTNVALSGFEVHEIHPSINVFNLNDEFVYSIHGSRRKIEIPAAQPASMAWMLMHSEHTERQIVRSRDQALTVARERPPVEETPGTGDAENETGIDTGYRYVRVDDLSPWIIRAVLTAEDGDFFFYGGVNPVTLAGAIERNILAGEILYGASTISMQLVKMLFLDQDRVFSRKAQEVALVYLMEQQVPVSKDRILELYLNLAEFGPGVLGIHDASSYYFDKDPRDLTAGEATWLASILPSPQTYHRYFEDGWISDGWFDRMTGLYDIMLERGRMTPDEYAGAIQQRPVFATP